MNSHVTDLLAAYHDGELSSNRRHSVDKHLQDCRTCRAELETLEKLSSLLRANPVPDYTPPERFAAQVQLRLPRTLSPRARQSQGQSSRWVLGIPLALIFVWAFLQSALRVAAFILTADNLLGQRTALFNSWLTPQGFFETTANLLLLDTVLLIGTIIFWSAWMALWIAWKKDKMNYLQKEV
ncbi:MAG: zf-HC2 domain-containing protein [Chloroflexi bacterium]|nr:zf-HC2 domain-containing protein [Chloroflexota bacterium]